MALTIPSKPKTFAPNVPPPGYRMLYVNFAATRKLIVPKLQLAHTNGGASQANIESAKAWAERRTYNGTATTLPTFQIDRDGDAAQFINSNQAQNACYKVNGWAISYETADTGYKADPSISAFTEAQLQKLANGFAYCSVLYKIPLAYPKTWDGPGTASHTEPFTYPYWTNSRGKICPGNKKKQQVRDIVIPHAIKIVQAWSGTTPTPTPPTKPPTKDWVAEGAKMTTPPGSPTLKKGVNHSNVQWLRAVLCSMPKLTADGGGPIFNPAHVEKDTIYGDEDVAAVKYWQSKNALTADGVYGTQTASKMQQVRGK